MMTGWRMRRVEYTGDLWQGEAVHPDLWDLLQRKDLLLEIASGLPPYPVTLGVPHHARAGADRIAEDWRSEKTGEYGRAADETTGLAGLAFLQALRERGIACRLVIACHATDHDPNKSPGSPYWESAFRGVGEDFPEDRPSGMPLLFELHGAAKHRRHALELSAGRNQVVDPALFGKALAYFFPGPGELACQLRPGVSEAVVYRERTGSSGRLQNPALGTLSLSHAGALGMPALHLEMKSIFRQPVEMNFGPPAPSPQAWQIARAVACAVELFNRSDDIRIAAADLSIPSTAFLTRPSLEYQESYLAATAETPLSEMNDNPELRIWSAREFANLVQGTRSVDYYGLPDNPPEEYLWLIDGGEFIGRVFFLHWLNDFRLQTDGQVDYWIRPSRRRQGYGKLILRLLLERFRQLGLERVLITCLETNHPSQKIIVANGGQFESRIQTPDWAGFLRPRLRYWIDLPPTTQTD